MHDSFEREATTGAPAPSAPFGERLGATLLGGSRCEFRVWAPSHEKVSVHILAPDDRRVALRKRAGGYHEGVAENCPAGARYRFVLGGEERPDPASRYQPEGVHGPSEVVSRDFAWTDGSWRGLPLEDLVVYELHVGTFTAEGTFDAVIPQLDELKDLGITAVELLPVAQFPGWRNWGYDGTYVGAAQSSYGGPVALKRLVDACHQRGMAILLDVVYNHLGPEGNYLGEYGPYFTDRYRTPWGLAINFDGAGSDHVRWFFIHSALQWVDEFHIDGLRVDAVHAIVDHTAQPFLQDLCVAIRARARELGRRIHSIAESDLNDPRVITPAEQLGLGFDAQWNDDFHHSLHTLLTGESDGYYAGYGRVSDLGRVMRSGYLYVGQHSTYRARRYGLTPNTTDGAKFVVCSQNHDQVGNRMMGDRLAAMVPEAKLHIAAAALVLSPFLPMLFMGEEYGETAPFQYFTSHSDSDLIEAVRKGRREEFDDFRWEGQIPDPHDEQTFSRSKLTRAGSASLRTLYKHLFRLRREHAALRALDLAAVEVHADDDRKVLLVSRSTGAERVLLAFNFGDEAQEVGIPFREAKWKAILGTETRVERSNVKLPPVSFGIFEA
ncbi:MAG TPA: malto-oligosyltrehalose trehalohydrolase [Thermoanaerobaculia bacterium]|nr:malto-oligosyltrehalose trehalohydrolase [Thermoanaerobaculia bacterium]